MAISSQCGLPGLVPDRGPDDHHAGRAGTPFEFFHRLKVVAALRGLDFVPIGPHYGQLSLAELQTIRPEAPSHIRWDPIPEIRPITEEQRRRLDYVLKNGSPAGWK